MVAASCEKHISNQTLLCTLRLYSSPQVPGLKIGNRASKIAGDNLNIIKDREGKVISSVTVALKELLSEP